MARKAKATVDYFPHDTEHGSTLYILESRWGNDGYAVWFKTLERLGSEDGHYIDCRKPGVWRFLQAYTKVSEPVLLEVLDTLAELGKIDKSLWSNKVIFCQQFLERVSDAYRRRINSLPSRAKVFIACGLAPDSIMSAIDANREQTDDINEEGNNQTDGRSTERERDSERERETKDTTTTAGRTKTELLFIPVFDEKEQTLKKLFPQHDFEVVKESCLTYYRNLPPPPDVYLIIVNWFKREQTSKPAFQSKGKQKFQGVTDDLKEAFS